MIGNEMRIPVYTGWDTSTPEPPDTEHEWSYTPPKPWRDEFGFLRPGFGEWRRKISADER